MTAVSRHPKFPMQTYACPIHKSALTEQLFCTQCNAAYPIKNGIPILINDRSSVFRISDYLNADSYAGASGYGGSLDSHTGLRKWYRRTIHWIGESNPVKKDFGVHEAVEHILTARPGSKILVIGSGDTTIRGDVTYSDVAFGANVTCIADAHDLPFLDMSFDACIAVAVLEHVVDPYRCEQEIRRVLRPGGFVYSETPFMQPVHMGAYDFTRFSYLGHRRLFRHFSEIRSGIAGGPGTSAGLMLRHALISVSDRPAIRKWLRLVGLLASLPLRYIDLMTRSKVGSYDSAAGFYLFGVLVSEPMPDRELLRLFRGG